MQQAGNLLNRIARPILNRRSYDPIRRLIPPQQQASKRTFLDVPDVPNQLEECICYYRTACEPDIFITAAFRSSVENEVFLFMKNEYVLLNYAPGTHDDKVLIGPNIISGSHEPYSIGVDCAFGSHHGNEAFIFCRFHCAHMTYEPGTAVFCIDAEMCIEHIVPSLEGTKFQYNLDAAFESSITDEAYLFKGNEYARINYRDGRLISINPIFSCLKNTIFEDGIDAAFASHRPDEAYLFKKDSYARINFVDDYIIRGVKKILPDEWPSLNGIVPRSCCHVFPNDDYVNCLTDDEIYDK